MPCIPYEGIPYTVYIGYTQFIGMCPLSRNLLHSSLVGYVHDSKRNTCRGPIVISYSSCNGEDKEGIHDERIRNTVRCKELECKDVSLSPGRLMKISFSKKMNFNHFICWKLSWHPIPISLTYLSLRYTPQYTTLVSIIEYKVQHLWHCSQLYLVQSRRFFLLCSTLRAVSEGLSS